MASEPTIDYVVTKMRFTLLRIRQRRSPFSHLDGSRWAEAMSIDRSFQESVQKALRSMETGLNGFNEVGAGRRGPYAIAAQLPPDAGPIVGDRRGPCAAACRSRRFTRPPSSIPVIRRIEGTPR